MSKQYREFFQKHPRVGWAIKKKLLSEFRAMNMQLEFMTGVVDKFDSFVLPDSLKNTCAPKEALDRYISLATPRDFSKFEASVLLTPSNGEEEGLKDYDMNLLDNGGSSGFRVIRAYVDQRWVDSYLSAAGNRNVADYLLESSKSLANLKLSRYQE